ncbi:MAG: TraR/DksA family transcriptional regulator [Rouxiella badensis]|uniref:TraR/DksA C4-type zinc finger protein n=1 Tax=Rouxiella badensis TaxID=1646377 RepID=UPI003C6B39B2
MADSMDLEQARQAEALERHIRAATSKPVAASSIFCEDCDEAIPTLRREKLIGVSRCVCCQEIFEVKSKHYRGAESK